MKEALEILFGKAQAEKMIGTKDIYKLINKNEEELKYLGYDDEEIPKIKALLEILDTIKQDIKLTKTNDPNELANVYANKLRFKEQEEMWLIALNGHNEITNEILLAKGTTNYVYVDMKNLLREALKTAATNIILIHNHPSGHCKPSREDDELTKQTLKATKLIGITLLDHIIISRNYYYSYMEDEKIINAKKRPKAAESQK